MALSEDFYNSDIDLWKSSLYNNNKEKNDSSSFSKADEIRKFKDLLDEGAITEEEYEKAKTKLLS